MHKELAIKFVNEVLTRHEKPNVSTLEKLSQEDLFLGFLESCRYVEALHRELIYPNKLTGKQLIAIMDKINIEHIETEFDVQKLIEKIIPAYFKIVVNDRT